MTRGRRVLPADLVEVVRQEPEPDGPRLVLADLLREQGQDDAAELIGVQCALARARAGTTESRSLARKQSKLLRALAKSWGNGWTLAGELVYAYQTEDPPS